MKKRIGLLTSYSRDDDRLFIKRPYHDFAEQFGEVILLTHRNEPVEDLDLLILPGGADVNPAVYGKSPFWLTQRPDIFREHFDINVLPKYMEMNMPIFGICRGHQAFAAHNGIELQQHLNVQVDEYVANQTSEIIATSKYAQDLLGVEEGVHINSLHHQVVRYTEELKKNPKVDVAALTVVNEKPIVEALIYKDYPAITVQWHPELIFDSFSMKAVRSLLAGKLQKKMEAEQAKITEA